MHKNTFLWCRHFCTNNLSRKSSNDLYNVRPPWTSNYLIQLLNFKISSSNNKTFRIFSFLSLQTLFCIDFVFFCLSSRVTRLGDLLHFGNFSKPVATIILPKSPLFLGNFCKGVKIFHFSSGIILGNFYRHFATFSCSHCSQVVNCVGRHNSKSNIEGLWKLNSFQSTINTVGILHLRP